MKDLFDEVNPTAQALYELEQQRKNRKYVPMLKGKGDLFAGPRPEQLSIEEGATPRTVSLTTKQPTETNPKV